MKEITSSSTAIAQPEDELDYFEAQTKMQKELAAERKNFEQKQLILVRELVEAYLKEIALMLGPSFKAVVNKPDSLGFGELVGLSGSIIKDSGFWKWKTSDIICTITIQFIWKDTSERPLHTGLSHVDIKFNKKTTISPYMRDRSALLWQSLEQLREPNAKYDLS